MHPRDFLHRHAGETAWVFGKGPSLTTFDPSTAGPLRIAINDAVSHVPACIYVFANDGARRWVSACAPGQVLFHPRRCLWEYSGNPIGAACDVVVFEDRNEDERMFLSREELAECLTVRRGTLATACQWLHIMGVSHVHLIGIDGCAGYAPGIDWQTEDDPTLGREYQSIRDESLDFLEIAGIGWTSHSANPIDRRGRRLVRITAHTVADGNPYYAGQIVTLPETIALELITTHHAELYPP